MTNDIEEALEAERDNLCAEVDRLTAEVERLRAAHVSMYDQHNEVERLTAEVERLTATPAESELVCELDRPARRWFYGGMTISHAVMDDDEPAPAIPPAEDRTDPPLGTGIFEVRLWTREGLRMRWAGVQESSGDTLVLRNTSADCIAALWNWHDRQTGRGPRCDGERAVTLAEPESAWQRKPVTHEWERSLTPSSFGGWSVAATWVATKYGGRYGYYPASRPIERGGR
jgi:hypothetical protein